MSVIINKEIIKDITDVLIKSSDSILIVNRNTTIKELIKELGEKRTIKYIWKNKGT